MLAASRFVVALSITPSFMRANAKVLFVVVHDYQYLVSLGFAVLCLENIVLIILWLNHNPIKFELRFIFLRYLIIDRCL